MKRLYVRPAGREPALIRRIHKRRYWRFFFRRSLYDDESAFKLRWFAVRNNVECEPRNPRFSSKILFRRFLATVPRFTRVINSIVLEIFVFTRRRYTIIGIGWLLFYITHVSIGQYYSYYTGSLSIYIYIAYLKRRSSVKILPYFFAPFV